jgi:fatty-acid desaturase
MAFIDYVLEPPSYGWQDEKGELIKPTTRQMLAEFFKRTNIFKSKKNWLAFFGWFQILCLAPFFVLFFAKYFTWWGVVAGFFYGMVLMGSHGTIWYHRYSTHRAFKFKNNFWRFITRNLVIKIVPEEAYVVSHHVHHSKSDQPGDPYNAYAGFLYCFLADVNHQPINVNLNEADYARVVGILSDTGVKPNTYQQYKKWGSVTNPLPTVIHAILSWGIWFAIFYLIGGPQLAFALFAGATVWAVGIRTFNFEGHGKGKDKRKEGMDFNWDDMSINQYWPGYVAGEWHNNHHLYPSSARSGFLRSQLDLAWCYVYLINKLGGIESYHDSKKQFIEKYYLPYKNAKLVGKSPAEETEKAPQEKKLEPVQ